MKSMNKLINKYISLIYTRLLITFLVLIFFKWPLLLYIKLFDISLLIPVVSGLAGFLVYIIRQC